MLKDFFIRLERRLVVTLGMVLACIGLFFILFDVKLDSGAVGAVESFQLAYVSTDRLQQTQKIEEQWQLLDSMPLFAPTKWNASQRLKLDHAQKIERNYAYYEPEFQLGPFSEKTNWDLASREAVVIEANELFLLRNRYFIDHFAELYRPAVPLSAAPPAFHIVVTAPDGSRMAKVVPYSDTEAQIWKAFLEPLDCTVHYQSGMQEILGTLVLSPSGDIDFDAFSESWIRSNFIAEFAEGSGVYAIRIYPHLH